jgi:hypothetical protein
MSGRLPIADKFLPRPGLARLSYLGSALVGLVSALWLFHFLREFPDPSGANGYFYLKQTESLASGVGFYFKDWSLAFLLTTVVMKICDNALLAFQISIAVVWGTLVFASGALIWNLSAKVEVRWRLALLFMSLGALVCTSPLYELTMTYFKNAFAVTLAMGALACFTAHWTMRRRLWSTGILTLLALLSHKSMILIAVCFALPWLVARASNRQRLVAAAFGAGLVAFFNWHFQNGKEYLQAIVHSLSGLGPWWFWISTLRWIDLEMLCSIAAVTLISSVALALRGRVSPRERFFVDGSCLFAIVALQPFQLPGPEGAAYRMILLTPLFAIPLLAVVFSSVPRKFAAVLLILGLFLAQPWMVTKHLDDVFTPWAQLRDDVLRIKQYVHTEDHLTSHHGLEFFIDETTGIRSRSFLSNHPEKKNFRVAFVADRWLRNGEAEQALREKALLEIGSQYILMLESDWQDLSRRYHLPKHWKNPDTYRPAFIYE